MVQQQFNTRDVQLSGKARLLFAFFDVADAATVDENIGGSPVKHRANIGLVLQTQPWPVAGSGGPSKRIAEWLHAVSVRAYEWPPKHRGCTEHVDGGLVAHTTLVGHQAGTTETGWAIESW